MGLRAQILLSLVVVTLGAIASVGAIAIWQTRQVLSADRLERAARMAELAARLVGEVVGAGTLDDPVTRGRVSRLVPEVTQALGADELAFFDERGEQLTTAQQLDSDGRGVTAALAGAPPHTEVRSTEHELILVAYASLPGDRGVVRSSFALDRAVDALLGRARASVVVLGAVDGLILLVVAAWILRGAVVRPVAALEQAARKVADGDLDARIDVRGPGELAQLADAFDRMTQSLKSSRESLIRSEKLAGVGRLAAGVAHEVGNPLAAILGYIETLLRETPEKPLDPEIRRDVLVRVGNETQRIDRIISELLAYARPPRDEVEAVEVAHAVEAALSLVRAQSRMRRVKTRVQIPVGLPAVRATEGRLTQVLLNLLLNAADATGGEGTITVDARGAGDRVVIGVADDGPGVPSDMAARIFDPFFSTKDVGHGTGLGLSVSQAIVEGYGGSLRLARAEKGARFEIDLPRAQASAMERA